MALGVSGRGQKSKATITPSLDKAMDKANPTPENAAPGISIRNGPMVEMDIDGPGVNKDTGKRKARNSSGQRKSYKEPTDDDDDDEKPLVCLDHSANNILDANSLQSKRRRVTTTKTISEAGSDSDDAPLVGKTGKSRSAKMLKKPPKISSAAIGESEDSDTPLGAKLAKEKAAIEKRAENEAKAIRKEEKASATSAKKRTKNESDGEDEPIIKKQQRKKSNGTSASASKKKKDPTGVKKDESNDDAPLTQRLPAKKKAPASSIPAKKGSKTKAAKKEETQQDQEAEEEEEEYRWWEDPTQGDGTVKWKTLEHNGVVFPPPYEPLPQNVKMLYEGTPVYMALEAEEIAGFFGAMLNSIHNVENPTFQKNFFNDFRKMLDETGGATDKHGAKLEIKVFTKCDFRPIFEYYDAQRAEKKALSGAEKKRLKAEKDAAEAPYMYCVWDGRRQKVGNFRVEPPGLFRGRGEHPKTGRVKKRVEPEQITINIGKEATVPAPPEGHRWKEIKHDGEGTWLAMWQENINGAYKYVMLAANSDVKGQSDYKKFEKARELKVRPHAVQRVLS